MKTQKPLKILLLGRNGQLGRALQGPLRTMGTLHAWDRSDAGGDYADVARVCERVRALRPDVIVNAAAYTAVDAAEDAVAAVWQTNVHAPAALAQMAKALGAWFVHFSSDYVFDGHGERAWTELDPMVPLNQYGRSKAAADAAILASGCRALIIRASWICGRIGANFLRTLLYLGQTQALVRIVDDQVGVPTPADWLAATTTQMLERARQDPSLAGLYHVVPSGAVSRYELTRYVFEQVAARGEMRRPPAVIPVTSAAFPSAASRPLNSRLDTHKLQRTFSIFPPAWQEGVDRILADLLGAGAARGITRVRAAQGAIGGKGPR